MRGEWRLNSRRLKAEFKAFGGSFRSELAPHSKQSKIETKKLMKMKQMKRIFFSALMAGMGLPLSAQIDETAKASMLHSKYISVLQYWKEHDIFQHLDVSVTAGTAGIGIDVASPIGEYVQLRAGYEFMPRFTSKVKFNMLIGGKPVNQYDENGNRINTTFERMKKMLNQFTGFDVADHVDMNGKPTMNNFKLLVDVFPFKSNKHWHFTAGFYWGSSQFAVADNTTEAMVSLLSVGMYNRLYDKAVNNSPLLDLDDLGLSEADQEKWGIWGMIIPSDIYAKIKSMGRLGFGVGYYKNDVFDADGNVLHHAGDSYMVEPGEDGMVHVKAKSNSFKPYIGFGYGGNLLKNRDDWKVSFDAGAMFWGGTPDLYIHDGTNLTVDVRGANGQVGDYIDVFKAFKVYPVLSVRFTKRIF